MSGISEVGIDQVRHKVMLWAPRGLGIEEAVDIPKMPRWQSDSSHPVDCLGYSIRGMSRANVVVFVPGWESARGCRIENAVCRSYDLPFVELADDGDGGYRIMYDGRRK